MEFLGYFAAVLIGFTLGLIGGGGSILTVPVMVYLMSVSPVTATAYSLFVVGITSLTGSFYYVKRKLVSYSTVILFFIPSFIAVFLTRKYLLPAIPEIIYASGDFSLTKSSFIMIMFALLMIVVCVSMLYNAKRPEKTADLKITLNYPLIIAEASAVGTLTGIVGIGGGFLIVPSLVGLVSLSMKRAVGTSLIIIACNSLIGFLGDLGKAPIEWGFLFIFSSFSVAGIFLGAYLSSYIPGRKLKPVFGLFVLLVGIAILVKEIAFNH